MCPKISSYIFFSTKLCFCCLLTCDVTVMSSALQSFLRAYTTYPAHLKHIFHIRFLHLGHTAKSFGLRDAPQGLSSATGAHSKKPNHNKNRIRSPVKEQKKKLGSSQAGEKR